MISNWAILLCKFSDDASDTRAVDDYKRLFTGAGTGTNNMTDYWRDMSHGYLDTTGSQVFGWYTLPIAKNVYAGNVEPAPPGQVNRGGLFDACRAAAVKAGVDLSAFAGVVVSMNGVVDLWGSLGGMAAFCDSPNLRPSVLGQEMGHGYGLDHSRLDGSLVDYQDPYDTMSTDGPYEAFDPLWTNIGPGLNAANMSGRGWLDQARVWTLSGSSSPAVVTLRPLHWPEHPGYLAAQLPNGYLVEFRVHERWDAGFPNAVVLVHRYEGNRSYLISNDAGNPSLGPGDSITRGGGRFGVGLKDRMKLTVDSVDAAAHSATIRIEYEDILVHPPIPEFPVPVISWPFPFSGAGSLAGIAGIPGSAVITGGNVIPIPSNSPAARMIDQLAAHQASKNLRDGAASVAIQKDALRRMLECVQAQLEEVSRIREPAPPSAADTVSGGDAIGRQKTPCCASPLANPKINV